MAIDTAAKRASCIGLGLVCLRLGVVPDAGALSASQRLHTQAFYSGIAAGVAASLPAADADSTWNARRRRTLWNAEARQTEWTAQRRRTEWTVE